MERQHWNKHVPVSLITKCNFNLRTILTLSTFTDLNDCLPLVLYFFFSAFLHNRAISIELQRNCVKEVSLFFSFFLFSQCLFGAFNRCCMSSFLVEHQVLSWSHSLSLNRLSPRFLLAMSVAR